MSCDSTFKQVGGAARKSGMSRLASRAAAYAGLAASAMGGIVLATAAWHCARRSGRLRRLLERSASANARDSRQAPALPARPVLAPTDAGQLSGPCAGCGASPRAKPGAWYVVDGRPHCQDCAPGAAERANVSLALAPTPRLDAQAKPGQSNPSAPTWLTFPPGGYRAWASSGNIHISVSAGGSDVAAGPEGEGRRGRLLDPTKGVKVELRRQRIKLTIEGLRQFPVDTDVYLVRALDDDGEPHETGLAVTPRVVVESGRARIDGDRWGITHIVSGRLLTGTRWFANPIEAETLAGILAQLDWRRPIAEVTRAELEDVVKTTASFHSALAWAKGRPRGK
jgi:hypothetical protein